MTFREAMILVKTGRYARRPEFQQDIDYISVMPFLYGSGFAQHDGDSYAPYSPSPEDEAATDWEECNLDWSASVWANPEEKWDGWDLT